MTTVIWSAIIGSFNKVNKIIQFVEIDLGTIEEHLFGYSWLWLFGCASCKKRSNVDHYEEEAKTFVDVEEYVAEK